MELCFSPPAQVSATRDLHQHFVIELIVGAAPVSLKCHSVHKHRLTFWYLNKQRAGRTDNDPISHRWGCAATKRTLSAMMTETLTHFCYACGCCTLGLVGCSPRPLVPADSWYVNNKHTNVDVRTLNILRRFFENRGNGAKADHSVM